MIVEQVKAGLKHVSAEDKSWVDLASVLLWRPARWHFEGEVSDLMIINLAPLPFPNQPTLWPTVYVIVCCWETARTQ
jgi:hypothetical protein